MIPAATMSRLAKLGLTPDQVDAVSEMMVEVEAATEAATEARSGGAIASRREADRVRKARQRARSRDKAGQHVTSGTKKAPRTPKENYQEKTNSAHAREARIDPDWEPSPADVEAVTDRGLPPDRLPAEVVAFREHHRGAGTLSADFGALFRGWVRHGQRNAKPARAAGQGARASPRAQPPPPDAGPRVDTPFAGRLPVSTLVAAHHAGTWRPGYGPPFGQPGCVIAAYLPKTSPATTLEPAE